MAYDSVRKLHILFGSQFTDDPHTWAYDLKANRWRDLKPSVMPPTNQNDAVLTFDSGNAMVIAIVKISEGKGDNAKSRLETWALDVHKNKWKKMNPPQEPDSSGNRARLLSFIPDLRLSILENRTHPPHGPAEQQIWMYRYRRDLVHGIPSEQPMPPTATRTQPRIVEDAVVSVRSEKAVELRWSPPAGRDVTGYHVERAAVEVWSEDQLTRLKKRTPPLAEPSVGAVRRIGAFTRLTKEPIRETSFTEQIDLTKPQAIDGKPLFERKLSKEHFDPDGKPYRFAVFAYRIRAVNALGVESGPSPYFLTIPSAPQSVFSREQGAACELKWVNNKEANVKGYRVYRMDGRFDNAAISRLTPEPVAGETFTDPQAGKATRRYYIVAVDALGQEGVPSAPVWFEREWKQFYKPFTTEWHQ
jgi:hypothetical protein